MADVYRILGSEPRHHFRHKVIPHQTDFPLFDPILAGARCLEGLRA
jgi:hypothetical protein